MVSRSGDGWWWRVVVGVVGCGVDRKDWFSECRDMDHEYVTGPVTGRGCWESWCCQVW